MTVERADREVVDDFSAFGILAFTTGRSDGSFGMAGSEPIGDVMGRWAALQRELAERSPRLATAAQVHGTRVLVHHGEWEGWLRTPDADGHVAPERGTAMAVTVADCVPVFLAHPSGAGGVVHAGWRGTAGAILAQGIAALAHRGLAAAELRVHLGPAICGRCYEVGPDVYASVRGEGAAGPTRLDLRAVLAGQARGAGVRHVSVSDLCTRCDNERFFSHRAGDAGRQLGVLVAES